MTAETACCSFARPTRSAIVSRALPSCWPARAALTVGISGPLHRYLGARRRRGDQRVPLRLLHRRGGDRACARHHRADAARRPPARLRRRPAGARDRRAPPPGRRSTGCCAPAMCRASTTSPPTPPIRRRWSSPCSCARTRPIRRPMAATASASLQRAGYPDIQPIMLNGAAGRGVQEESTAWRWRWTGTSSRARRPRAASRRSTPPSGSASTTTSWCASGRRQRQPHRHPLQEPRRPLRSRRQRPAHPGVHGEAEGGALIFVGPRARPHMTGARSARSSVSRSAAA